MLTGKLRGENTVWAVVIMCEIECTPFHILLTNPFLTSLFRNKGLIGRFNFFSPQMTWISIMQSSLMSVCLKLKILVTAEPIGPYSLGNIATYPNGGFKLFSFVVGTLVKNIKILITAKSTEFFILWQL